jgi:hypothetical protein
MHGPIFSIFDYLMIIFNKGMGSMTTVQPEEEKIRRATKWLIEERKYSPEKSVAELIEEACLKFDLSPMDAEFLQRFVKDEKL